MSTTTCSKTLWGQLRNRGGPLWSSRCSELGMKILVSLGGDFWRWWVYRSLQGPVDNRFNDRGLFHTRVTLEELLPSEMSKRRREDVPAECVAAMRSYGYLYDPDEQVFHLENDWNSVRLNPPCVDWKDSREPVGELREPLIRIPDRRDPLIFSPHMGRGQTGWYCQESAVDEGLSDADCVLEYLRAYNALIRCPSPANYVAATLSPDTSKGPYAATLGYLDAQKRSPDFVGLLFVGFLLQWKIFGLRSPSSGCGSCSGVDMLMFHRVLERYVQDHPAS